ncbi:urea transporter, partial [Staphylococcus aureus]|uniref:urea transporter n=1 Tax=Staphylococcus aureus TaxID=1280 RepID=UPI00155300A8
MKIIDVLLKNISQVVLISNKWTGLFILIGLFVADWTIGLAAIVGSIIAYTFARFINYSEAEVNKVAIIVITISNPDLSKKI